MAITSSALVKKFFELLNNKDFDNLEKYLSPDVVFHFPGTKPLHGPKKVVQLLKIIYRRYTNLTFEIKEVIIQGERIAAVWQNAGTDTTGNQYKNEGVTIFQVEDDKVTYMNDYFKDTSFTTAS